MRNQSLKLIKRLFTMKHHAGSGDNVSFFRLVKQGMPYYLYKDGRASYPMTIFITINSRCNLKCKMCDIGQCNQNSIFYKNLIGENIKDFPLDLYKGLIDEVKDFKPYISLTTTEPLLYKDLFNVIDYTVLNGLKINVTTNGYILERMAEDIVKSGLNKLSISIDGPKEIHDKMRGVEGTFERVKAGITKVMEVKKRLKKDEPWIMINTSITDYNYPHLVEMLESLPLEDITHCNLKLMVFCTQDVAESHNQKYGDKYLATPTCLSGGIEPTKIDIDVLYEQAKIIKNRFVDKCTLYFDIDKKQLFKYFNHPEEFMDDTRCVMPWFVAQVTVTGDLIGLTRCYPARFGNIKDGGFKKQWQGEKLREFRRDLKRDGRFLACTRCDGVLFR